MTRTESIFQMGIFLFMELDGYILSVSEALSYVFPFLDIDGIMLYALIIT